MWTDSLLDEPINTTRALRTDYSKGGGTREYHQGQRSLNAWVYTNNYSYYCALIGSRLLRIHCLY